MVYILLGLLVSIVVLLLTWLHRTFTYWERKGVPFEPPLWIYGNLKDVGSKLHFHDLNQRIYKRFKNENTRGLPPPFVGLYYGFGTPVFIMDLDLIRNITIKDFNNFHDRGIYHNVRDDPLTGNLLALEGAVWRAMRQKMTAVFSSGKMKNMFPIITAMAGNLTRLCINLAGKPENGGGVIEIKDMCARFTTDVIGSCVFGIECNCLQDPTAIFRKNGRDLIERQRHSLLVHSIIMVLPNLARRLRIKVLPDDLSEFFLNTVRDTVEERLRSKVKRNDFIDTLIEMRAPVDTSTPNDNWIDLSRGLSIEQMAAQSLVFFFAGFDTSASTMTFCLYELALNPVIQHRLREEIFTVLRSHGDEITYDSMKEMKYLDQVVAETLRKYPALSHMVRKSIEAYPVPDTDQVIPANTTIIIPSSSIQHDPAYFPHPERFDPERFTAEAIAGRHPCAYLPFGSGPRSCIGFRFGKMQTKIGLIILLRQFQFKRCDSTEIPVQINKKAFVMTAQSGVYLEVQRLRIRSV